MLKLKSEAEELETSAREAILDMSKVKGYHKSIRNGTKIIKLLVKILVLTS